MIILTLNFFIIPVGNFVKIPIKLMPNISTVEIQESRGSNNIIKNEGIKDIDKTKNIKEQKYEDEIEDKVKDESTNIIWS